MNKPPLDCLDFFRQLTPTYFSNGAFPLLFENSFPPACLSFFLFNLINLAQLSVISSFQSTGLSAMMGCEDSITLTLIGNHDFQLLLWNPADVELLRSRYRMVCTYIGCLPSNPLQNLDHSLPALVSYEQLLILLGFGGFHSPWDTSSEKQEGRLKINLELLTPLRCSSLADYKDSKDLALALPKAPAPFLHMLSRLRASPQFSIYEYLYSLPKNLFITSGSKFGGDFLLYYDDPSKCHSQHIVNVVDYKQPIKNRQLVSFGRLATGVGKTRVLAAIDPSPLEGQAPRTYIFTLEWSGMI